MEAYFDADQHARAQQLGRLHPWTVTTKTPNGRYYNFREHPEQIRTGLEDLQNARGTEPESAIVDFIAWANGSSSIFETNDFGLRPLQANISGISPKALEHKLRVTVLFRDLTLNTPKGKLANFACQIEATLSNIDPDFDQACWGWTLWPHLFTAIGDENNPRALGDVVQYMLWAWGDTDEEAGANLARSLTNLRTALERAQHWYLANGFEKSGPGDV
jgi:hypothetical protein